MVDTIHSVRKTFSLDKFLKARTLTIKAVDEVRSKAFVGMTESDGKNIIDSVLKNMGAENKWHPNKFRIGQNTVKSFREESDEEITLLENDLFFIDIGPVWENHEGDYGNTFTLGSSVKYTKIANACRDVFNKTSLEWKNKDLTGAELYDFASTYAESLGYSLNKKMKGHRLGDFPHHLFYKGGLLEIDEKPCENLWVLEIHLVSRDNKYGAFFEDILISI